MASGGHGSHTEASLPGSQVSGEEGYPAAGRGKLLERSALWSGVVLVVPDRDDALVRLEPRRPAGHVAVGAELERLSAATSPTQAKTDTGGVDEAKQGEGQTKRKKG